MKRIVICADGTWDNPSSKDGNTPAPTNVAKLATNVAANDNAGVSQIICYHPGVGTSGNIFDILNGGGIGVGISQTIQDLYMFLMFNYTPGDELWLFGFSRGAYTVRSLAGLIRNCGVLKKEHSALFKQAYNLYRDRTDLSHPMSPTAQQFKEQYSWPEFDIKFIGVWDTVGALGLPIIPWRARQHLWQFHDVELSSHVQNAFQALAIDERRKMFTPCIWQKQAHSVQTLEQAWFPGVHSNIGGGYADDSLSDCALWWMTKKARSCGLAIDTAPVLGNPDGVMANSMNFWFRLQGTNIRQPLNLLPLSCETMSSAALLRKNYLWKL